MKTIETPLNCFVLRPTPYLFMCFCTHFLYFSFFIFYQNERRAKHNNDNINGRLLIDVIDCLGLFKCSFPLFFSKKKYAMNLNNNRLFCKFIHTDMDSISEYKWQCYRAKRTTKVEMNFLYAKKSNQQQQQNRAATRW